MSLYTYIDAFYALKYLFFYDFDANCVNITSSSMSRSYTTGLSLTHNNGVADLPICDPPGGIF